MDVFLDYLINKLSLQQEILGLIVGFILLVLLLIFKENLKAVGKKDKVQAIKKLNSLSVYASRLVIEINLKKLLHYKEEMLI